MKFYLIIITSIVRVEIWFVLQAAQGLADLLETMGRVEPRNPGLFDEFAKIFCRIVSYNHSSLTKIWIIAILI